MHTVSVLGKNSQCRTVVKDNMVTGRVAVGVHASNACTMQWSVYVCESVFRALQSHRKLETDGLTVEQRNELIPASVSFLCSQGYNKDNKIPLPSTKLSLSLFLSLSLSLSLTHTHTHTHTHTKVKHQPREVCL